MQLIATTALLGSFAFLSGCSAPAVQEARAAGVERRQDRIDARTYARQERCCVRAEREDARAAARFNSW